MPAKTSLASASDSLSDSTQPFPSCQLDQARFTAFVARHQLAMTRLAMRYVRDPATAQDVVQETWVAVMLGISHFRGQGPFRNWVYGILVNLAKSRGVHDARVIPFSSCAGGATEGDEVAQRGVLRQVAPAPGDRPPLWGIGAGADRLPEDKLREGEIVAALIQAISELPASQRAVIYLRDVRGLTASETCSELGISDVAQRVRLHRARSHVARSIHAHFDAHELNLLLGGAARARLAAEEIRDLPLRHVQRARQTLGVEEEANARVSYLHGS